MRRPKPWVLFFVTGLLIPATADGQNEQSKSQSSLPPTSSPTTDDFSKLPTITFPDEQTKNQGQKSGAAKLPDQFPPAGGTSNTLSDQQNSKVLAPNNLRNGSNNQSPKRMSLTDQLPINSNPNALAPNRQGQVTNQGQVTTGVLSVQSNGTQMQPRTQQEFDTTPPIRQQNVLNQSRQPTGAGGTFGSPNSQPNFQNLNRQQNVRTNDPPSVLQRQPNTASTISSIGDQNGGIAPVTYQQTTPPVSNATTNRQTPSNTSIALQILGQFDPAKIEGSLPGEPVGLINVMQNTAPNSRLAASQKYWNCFGAWLRLQFAEQEAQVLRQLQMPQSAHEQTMLKTAVAMGESRLQQAKVNLQRAQRALSPYARTQHRDILPLAKDLPLVQGYQTHYDLYARRRMLPGRARQLDQSLPQQKNLIESNAKLVQQSRGAASQARQAYAMGQATVASLLEAVRLMQAANTQFANSVVQYNASTAEYAFMVASPYQNPRTVASMLIPRPSFTPQLSSIANQNVVNSNLPTAQFGRPTRYQTTSVLNSSRLPDNQQIVGRSNPQTPRVASLPPVNTQNRTLPQTVPRQTPITGQVNPRQWNRGTGNPPPASSQQNGQLGGARGSAGGGNTGGPVGGSSGQFGGASGQFGG